MAAAGSLLSVSTACLRCQAIYRGGGLGKLKRSANAEAFYVKCDRETNSPDVIEAGQVVAEIGIAPVRAEDFTAFRNSPFTANAPDVSKIACVSE